ncbi:MAG: DUF692 family protein [Betaproteobacteria bacterium]|nr:DUF692 family protein [Betaproteobacteria bacterium]
MPCFALEPQAGIGLRQPHYEAFRRAKPDIGFVEVHSENFFNPHDAAAQVLASVRAAYPVSLHGVGLALGSACGLDAWHLDRLAELVSRVDPVRVSDHASFARAPWNGRVAHANDLLPIPFTKASLAILSANVARVQERLRRPILIENLSAYLDFSERDYSEPGFFAEISRRTGCGLLLDINNLMVNALNARAPDPLKTVCDWLNDLVREGVPGLVREIHLAGHSAQHGLVIDDHSEAVSSPVWSAYRHALHLFGPVPTLIEWDERLPALEILLGEAWRAQSMLEQAARMERQDSALAPQSPPALVDPTPSSAEAMTAPSMEAEMLRQATLVAAIFSPVAPMAPTAGIRQDGESWIAGLRAYRGNGQAHAVNALRMQFPTLVAQLGDDAFRALCARYRQIRPPLRGDLAWMGEAFADFLAQQNELAPWPWLADSARLDWALWRVLYEPPARLTEGDLERLAEMDPASLRLRLAPGTRLLCSNWAIVTLWTLHKAVPPDEARLRAAILDAAENAWVWREGWQAKVRPLSEPEMAWIRSLNAASDLGAALESVTAEMDLHAWLREAVTRGWIAGVEPLCP